MPSPTSEPRRSRARLATAVPPAGRQAVHTMDPTKPVDVRDAARQARTREYMRAENEREAVLTKKGYCF